MGNAAGAQQNPQYCMLAGALNVSFDGGATWTAIGSGVPADGSITNAKLANMAANTVKGSIAGGVPADLTKTQLTTLINAATGSLSGAMTPADASYVHTWFNDQQAWLTSKLASMTEFRGFLGGVGPLPTGGAAGTLEGGALGATTNAWAHLSTPVWQAPKTSGFGFVIRGAFAVLSSTNQQMGIVNVAETQFCVFNVWTSENATNITLRLFDGTETDVTLTVPDTAAHDYAMVFDPGTGTITAYIDKTSVGSTATVTHLLNVPAALTVFNVGPQISKAIWGYVAP